MDGSLVSIRTINWVLSESDAHGFDRLVMIALADEADDNGLKCWPALRTIAAKAHVSVGAARASIDRLEEVGDLVVWRPEVTGRGNHNFYGLVMGRSPLEVAEALTAQVAKIAGRKAGAVTAVDQQLTLKGAAPARFPDEKGAAPAPFRGGETRGEAPETRVAGTRIPVVPEGTYAKEGIDASADAKAPRERDLMFDALVASMHNNTSSPAFVKKTAKALEAAEYLPEEIPVLAGVLVAVYERVGGRSLGNAKSKGPQGDVRQKVNLLSPKWEEATAIVADARERADTDGTPIGHLDDAASTAVVAELLASNIQADLIERAMAETPTWTVGGLRVEIKRLDRQAERGTLATGNGADGRYAQADWRPGDPSMVASGWKYDHLTDLLENESTREAARSGGTDVEALIARLQAEKAASS